MTHWTELWRKVAKLVVCLYLAVVTGCGYLPSKKCCPVYLPNDHLLGNEALRVPPCGPDDIFYGLKKTAWREWPEEWKLWQPSPVTTSQFEPIPADAQQSAEPLQRLQPPDAVESQEPTLSTETEPAPTDQPSGPAEGTSDLDLPEPELPKNDLGPVDSLNQRLFPSDETPAESMERLFPRENRESAESMEERLFPSDTQGSTESREEPPESNPMDESDELAKQGPLPSESMASMEDRLYSSDDNGSVDVTYQRPLPNGSVAAMEDRLFFQDENGSPGTTHQRPFPRESSTAAESTKPKRIHRSGVLERLIAPPAKKIQPAPIQQSSWNRAGQVPPPELQEKGPDIRLTPLPRNANWRSPRPSKLRR